MEEIVAEHPASAMQENSLMQIYMGALEHTKVVFGQDLGKRWKVENVSEWGLGKQTWCYK